MNLLTIPQEFGSSNDITKKRNRQGLPWRSSGETLSSSAGSAGSIRGQRTGIPHALKLKKPQSLRQKQYSNKFSKGIQNGLHPKKILKKEKQISINILGDFSIHFSVTDRINRPKVDMIIKLGLVETPRTLHPKTVEQFLSKLTWTFTKIGQMLSFKANLNKF